MGKRLESATGELLIQAGWVAYDSGLQQLSRRLYTEAFLLAKVSGRDEVAAHALSNMSLQANALGYPKDAVRFAEAAQHHADSWATPRVRVLFSLRQGRGLASLGADSACDTALGAATSYFDAGPREDDPNWIGHLNEEGFAAHAGACLMDLGRVTAAGDVLEKSAGSLENSARNRSGSTIRYKLTLLLSREVDKACAVGIRVLPVIFSLSSTLIVNELQEFCEDLRGYPSTRAANEFLDSVRAHMTSRRR